MGLDRLWDLISYYLIHKLTDFLAFKKKSSNENEYFIIFLLDQHSGWWT